MPRDLRASENTKRAKAKRDSAMARREFSYPSEPRTSAAGMTSLAIKVMDPKLRALIDAALARREGQ